MNKGRGMMKGIDKIKLLKEILGDKDLVSKEILKEEPEEGTLIVEAEGESPEAAKEDMLKTLEGMELPDEEDMEGMMPEMEDEYEDEMCEDDLECSEEMMMDEDEDFEISDEDAEIMDMIPSSQREAFKKRLLEKIKSL